MHIKNVLVPVDFSPPSSLAVNYGIALARKFRAKLMLLHVVESPAALMYALPVGAEKIEKQRYDQAERMLSALVGPEDEDDLDVRYLVKLGEIGEQIDLAVREHAADIVVMGTHGRGLFGRLFIGSVTQSMLRKLAVPVLTICRVSRPLEFNRILFAADLSDASKEGFRCALELAETMGSRLIVAHVMDKKPEVAALYEQDRRAATNEARAQLAEFEAEGNRRGVKVETVLDQGPAADTIIRLADENMADFIILPVGKKGFIERTLLGSTAEPAVREAHVPILSIPIAAPSAASERGRKPTEHRVA
ncbi:MAG: universal stress protein [Acidobacteria bacterium]|nr:universal stress protein [Acidobacteriota bacterium]